MSAIRTAFLRLRSDKRGATAIEYGLLTALIAVALVTGVGALGGGTNGMWTNMSNDVGDVL